jgi:hypothetical protein
MFLLQFDAGKGRYSVVSVQLFQAGCRVGRQFCVRIPVDVAQYSEMISPTIPI